ncbi:WS/DGAT/MGAT family O-acyltransferase [Pseudonocardia sp. RS010]|uniref:WS/DGAT/MGAT family O-acyltransferase n=1 Tax=Pseudonocardia sp. RS010 TaxID=3385979 RepID=UPI0039A3DEED
MQLVPPMDAVYLLGESRTSPNHVVALQIFQPPEDAPEDFLDTLYESMTDTSRLKPAFRRRPHRSLGTAGWFVWAQEPEVDLTLQVRRAGLPRPGRIRELLELVATFHETPLERDRPLWQARLVEGLDDGRFALCTKMHHSMFDGVNMGRHLLGGLSPDPADRSGTAPWITPSASRSPRTASETSPVDAVRGIASAVRGIVDSLPTLVRAGREALGPDANPLPFTAPPTMFNTRVSSARRFAGDAWPKARLRTVARRAGTTLNDVAVTMCAGALRRYLIEQLSLPAEPLVAMIPVSADPREGGVARDGNAWTAALCDLGTETNDVHERLRRIHTSIRRSRRLVSELDPITAGALSAAVLGGQAANLVPGLPTTPRPPFNVVLSTVPAMSTRLHLNGCALTDNYPLSVVVDGQALNITMISYVGELAFGITGCPRSVPHLQRLLEHLEASLREVEEAIGV